MIGALDLKLDNHTGFLVLVDDVWSATQKIQRNIGGISKTQQIMKGEKNNKNCFDWQWWFTFYSFQISKMILRKKWVKLHAPLVQKAQWNQSLVKLVSLTYFLSFKNWEVNTLPSKNIQTVVSACTSFEGTRGNIFHIIQALIKVDD